MCDICFDTHEECLDDGMCIKLKDDEFKIDYTVRVND